MTHHGYLPGLQGYLATFRGDEHISQLRNDQKIAVGIIENPRISIFEPFYDC